MNRQQLAQLEVLWTATETGDHELVDSILEQGKIAPDITDEEGITLVHTAAANGHEKVMKCLIDRGASVNSRSFYLWTPLMQASAYGQISCSSMLVEQGAELDATNVMGASALVCASRGGHASVVRSLLEAGASVNNKLGTVNPLMSGAIAGHESVCRMLIDKGADVNTMMKDTGWTPLMFAAHNGYLNVVQLLVTNGADTNAVNTLEAMALDLCIASDHSEVKRYLEKNSDATLSNTMKRRMRADLFQATKDGDFDQCKALVDEAGADVNRKDDDGATCLIFAAMRGWLAISELLVDSGAEVDVQDEKSGWTALMQATYYGHKSIALLLIESGADISLQAGNGCTAFDIASIIGDTEVVRLLAQASMRGNTSSAQKRRPGKPAGKSRNVNLNASKGSIEWNAISSPAPRGNSPLKPPSPRGSPQLMKKVLSNQPSSLLSLRAREKDGTLRPDRGPTTLSALADAGADLGDDTLRSSQHSIGVTTLGSTFGSAMQSTTSTMGSTISSDATDAALRLAKSNSLENERRSKKKAGKEGASASGRKGSSLRPFSSQNKVSPSKASKAGSSGRPGSAEKKYGKKKSWWRRTAARFAKFLRRSARVEVSPTGPASVDTRQQQQQQRGGVGARQPSSAWGSSKSPTVSYGSSSGSSSNAGGGTAATQAGKVDTLPKKDRGKGRAGKPPGSDMVVPRFDQSKPRASTTSISSSSTNNSKAKGGGAAAGAASPAREMRVKSPAAPSGPAPPPWTPMSGLIGRDPMNLSILSAAQNGEIAQFGGPGKRPSLNMGAPMSRLPADIMAPIKPPFMPPPAFELHHIERPKFQRPSTRASLPDAGGGESRPRSSKPFVRPSMHGHAVRNSVDKKTWSLPRKSVDAGSGGGGGGGGPASKFGPAGPKKRKSGPRVSFLSPTSVEDQKKRASSTSSSGSSKSSGNGSSKGAAGGVADANNASGGSAGSSLNNSGADVAPRKREALTLKDVLQRHTLMEHFALFDEQDIDLEAFLLMTDEDMVELGLKDGAARAKFCAIIAKIRSSKQTGISKVDSAVTQFRNANAERRRSSMISPRRAGSTSSVNSNAPMPLPPKQQSRPPQGRLPQVREAAGGKKPNQEA